MQFARLIARWFKPVDLATLREDIRRLHAGEIDRLELPPGFSYSLALPECPKCGYRAEGDADGGKCDAEGGGRPRVAGDLARPEIGIVRDQRGSERVISPLTKAERAEARGGHSCILPAGSHERRNASRTERGHGVPPLHVFIDRIHRRIMGGKPAVAQEEAR